MRTLFMRILASSTVSSASTMHTVSLRFLPCNRAAVDGDGESRHEFAQIYARSALLKALLSSQPGPAHMRSRRPP